MELESGLGVECGTIWCREAKYIAGEKAITSNHPWLLLRLCSGVKKFNSFGTDCCLDFVFQYIQVPIRFHRLERSLCLRCHRLLGSLQTYRLFTVRRSRHDTVLSNISSAQKRGVHGFIEFCGLI